MLDHEFDFHLYATVRGIEGIGIEETYIQNVELFAVDIIFNTDSYKLTKVFEEIIIQREESKEDDKEVPFVE